MDKERKLKVFITGASGFIGRNIFEFLSKTNGIEVIGTFNTRAFLVNPPHKLLKLNLADLDRVVSMLEEARPDFLIHAASVTAGGQTVAKNPEAYLAKNVRMNIDLIEAAYNLSIPECIFFGCAIAYPLEDRLVGEEDIDFDGRRSSYPEYRRFAEVKVTMEKFCRIYSELGSTRFTVIRHSNIYGPYDKFTGGGHFFADTLSLVCQGEDGDMIVIGRGNECRDLLYSYDFVRFIYMFIKSKNKNYRYNVFNVGSAISYSLYEIAQKIVKVSGKKIHIHTDCSKSSLPTQPALDYSKAKEYFGWTPTVALEDGIKRTIDWYKNYNTVFRSLAI